MYVIGIDSGGTKTRIKIADMQGAVLYEGYAEAGNIYSNSEETVRNNLSRLVNTGLDALNLSPADCSAFVIGSAGVERKNGAEILTRIIKNMGFGCKTVVTNDAHTALAGGLGEPAGIVLIAGTGSICYGNDGKGQSFRSGGYGHILSDEGSAYDIAAKGMKAVLRSLDGRSGKTALADYFREDFGLGEPKDIIEFVLRGKEEIAALAQTVDKAAQEGDEVAVGILDGCADELFELIRVVYEKLFTADASVGILFSGSVAEKNRIIRNRLMSRISAELPALVYRESRYDAAYGAVLIGLSITGE